MTDPKSIRAIDAVVNIWTEEALSHRPDWGDDFFVGKMKAKSNIMPGLSLEAMIERMDAAGIDHGFLIAAKSGRIGLPGCYHMPPQVVADAVQQHPDKFSGLIGIDPTLLDKDGCNQRPRQDHHPKCEQELKQAPKRAFSFLRWNKIRKTRFSLRQQD